MVGLGGCGEPERRQLVLEEALGGADFDGGGLRVWVGGFDLGELGEEGGHGGATSGFCGGAGFYAVFN